MKIKDVVIFEVSGHADGAWLWRESRAASPLDIYSEAGRSGQSPAYSASREPKSIASIYAEIVSDEGPAGLYGPILKEQAFIIHKNPLKPGNGWLSLPAEPGLGLLLDEEKIEARRELAWA